MIVKHTSFIEGRIAMFWKTPLIKHLFKDPIKEEESETIEEVRAEESQRLNESYHQAIGRMAAFFAHEIRNPLTSIIGFAQFLEQDEIIRSHDNLSQYISIIKEESMKMEVLIEELLNLSKAHLHQDHLSIIDIEHSINKIISIFEMQDRYQDIHFQTQVSKDCYVLGNVHQFERVLLNLLNNGIEAMQEKGIIEISVHKRNVSVLLDIIDDGPGILPEDMERIFLPFFTTKDEGTGIGLPVCRTIIEAMNGTLKITNHPTKGIHVSIELPQSKHMTYGSSETIY